MSNISAWSATDENNNNIPPNGFPEHQSPSSVNNSARALMGGVRRAYLEQPYFNPGGAIQYVNDSTFSIKDTNEITDFSVFYRVGRRLKAVSVSGVIYGNVGAVSYNGGVTEVKCAWDSGNVLNSQTTAVYCGLAREDTGEIVGRLPVGMILPYTAMSLPPGFLYADGKSFDPSIYTALAELWKTGEDTYLYGQEAVGGKYWPKTPDVRGQFPRYLDMGAGIDPDSETREIGSVQTDAIRNITGDLPISIQNAGVSQSGGALSSISPGNKNGIYGLGSTNYISNIKLDASAVVPTAEENRPTNMAFPALIVAWHGITPAENITIQDLLTAFNTMQGSIDQIYEAKDEALVALQTEADEIVNVAETQISTASTNAVNLVDDTATSAVGTVNATSQTAVSTVNTAATEAIEDVNTQAKAAVDAEIGRITNAGEAEVQKSRDWATANDGVLPDNERSSKNNAAVSYLYAEAPLNQEIETFSTDNVAVLNVGGDISNYQLVELYNNGGNWYKVFKETNPTTKQIKYWCEQGLRLTKGSDYKQTFPLLLPYADTNYNVILSSYIIAGGGYTDTQAITNISTDSVEIAFEYGETGDFYIETKGYVNRGG